MTNDLKADGWVAWHPEEKFYPTTDEGGVFVAEDEEHLVLSNNSSFSKRMIKNGWRIRPVKRQFLDEPQPDPNPWIFVRPPKDYFQVEITVEKFIERERYATHAVWDGDRFIIPNDGPSLPFGPHGGAEEVVCWREYKPEPYRGEP